MARSVWALAREDITELIGNIHEPQAKAWLSTVIEALPHEELTRVVVTLWALWYARPSMRESSKTRSRHIAS
jgi:hypothetical protein